MTDCLQFERKGPIAALTLNRPANGNAINAELAKALRDAAIDCDEDDAIRCVVLSGAGRLFCAGGDIQSFAAANDSVPALMKQLTVDMHMAIARFARMRKPLVTKINGPAAGAGLSFAVLGDIAIAARSAHFSLAYSALGVSPDGGATWWLPRLIGMRRAQYYAYLNERISADEAERIGLITRSIDDGSLDAETSRIAGRLASGPTGAFGRTRELLLASLQMPLETQMEAEARAIADCARNHDGRQGIKAFIDKQRPLFQGK